MAELIVGVSGMAAVDNPGPGIGVARSLREASELELSLGRLLSIRSRLRSAWPVSGHADRMVPGGDRARVADR